MKNLGAVLEDVAAAHEAELPQGWVVWRRPVNRPAEWPLPLCILQGPRGAGGIRTADGGEEVELDVLYLVSTFDDDGDDAELMTFLDTDGAVERVMAHESAHFSDLNVVNWALDEPLLTGTSLMRGLRVSFSCWVPG